MAEWKVWYRNDSVYDDSPQRGGDCGDAGHWWRTKNEEKIEGSDFARFTFDNAPHMERGLRTTVDVEKMDLPRLIEITYDGDCVGALDALSERLSSDELADLIGRLSWRLSHTAKKAKKDGHDSLIRWMDADRENRALKTRIDRLTRMRALGGAL